MGIKLFHRSQRDLAASINQVIDQYWNDAINEKEMVKSITDLYEMNQSKMLKEGQFTTVLRQQCGKRRLEVVNKIIRTR